MSKLTAQALHFPSLMSKPVMGVMSEESGEPGLVDAELGMTQTAYRRGAGICFYRLPNHMSGITKSPSNLSCMKLCQSQTKSLE